MEWQLQRVAPWHCRRDQGRRWRIGIAGVITTLLLAGAAGLVALTRNNGKQPMSTSTAMGTRRRTAVSLSQADLYTRSGAAQDVVAAQNEHLSAANMFERAVLDETRTTRELAERAEFEPTSMASSMAAKAELDANVAKMKSLAEEIKTAAQKQKDASTLYVQASQRRYTAVAALQAELAQEAQAAYDVKAAVVGTADTDPDRFDPTSENAPAFDPSDPQQDKYHIARLVGVDSDGSTSLCGRAEVKHDDTWGQICSRGFTQASAETFCKSMGLAGGAARYHDNAGNPTWDDTVITRHGAGGWQTSSDVIWMSRVKCSGSESNILQCPFGSSESDAQDWRSYDASDGVSGALLSSLDTARPRFLLDTCVTTCSAILPPIYLLVHAAS